MPPPKRMTANPQRPTRHRAGKPTGASSSSESDSEASDDETAQQPERKIAPPPKVPSAGKIISNLGKIDLNARRQEEEAAAEARRKAAEKAARAAVEEGFVTEEEEEEESEEDEEDESDDEEEEEEEESSEDEAPRKPLMLKPKFVPKSQRNGGGGAKDGTSNNAEDEEVARQKAEEEEAAQKKKAMDELVEEQLRKDAAARAAGKKHWDDAVDEEEDVDTEDDKDPAAEYAAWKLRELRRIKREREAIEARERERAEVERRRNLTDEERRAEDAAFLAQQKEEKDGRGKMGYLQKYHHRGAFYRGGDDEAEALANRDIMGARFADDVQNRELLPKALQLRDMTRLGRKGATKYRDLKSEDTGAWGAHLGRDSRRGRGGGGGGGEFDSYHNVDDRFKSDREREREGPGGANAIPLGERKGGGVPVEGMETGIETENETVIVMIGIATGLETTTIVDEIGGPGRDLDPDRPGDATAMIIIVGKGIPHGIQGATTAIKGVG
ncbi:putative microfibril-associated protein [Eutypa lata UCREL1]|uniref:Putative microfibril-associated protein n=1 Tax=Eutypa lata (strain UCR-EL1) TaxID=1287681 RepID=M7TCD3_EUTLA|nr:putative microfibril-associated protein [Eutypa lata UCREL1]